MRTRCASAGAWARWKQRRRRERSRKAEGPEGSPRRQGRGGDGDAPLCPERDLLPEEAEGDDPGSRVYPARAEGRPARRSRDPRDGPARAASGRDREGLVYGREERQEEVRLRQRRGGQVRIEEGRDEEGRGS